MRARSNSKSSSTPTNLMDFRGAEYLGDGAFRRIDDRWYFGRDLPDHDSAHTEEYGGTRCAQLFTTVYQCSRMFTIVRLCEMR